MTEPVWIEIELVHAIHDRQLAEHGGLVGLRDAAALESALARAQNRWVYGETDLCVLEHRAKKWEPVFRKNDATTKT